MCLSAQLEGYLTRRRLWGLALSRLLGLSPSGRACRGLIWGLLWLLWSPLAWLASWAWVGCSSRWVLGGVVLRGGLVSVPRLLRGLWGPLLLR